MYTYIHCKKLLGASNQNRLVEMCLVILTNRFVTVTKEKVIITKLIWCS